MLSIQQLFGDFPVDRFIAEHLHRIPLALPGSAHAVKALDSWAALESMLAQQDADISWARDGEWYMGERPPDLAAAYSLANEGWTTVVRHAERTCSAINELATEFVRAFRGAVDIHMFFTPAGRRGFSWHYDAEDVFIIQTSGEKEYFLRKNTVNPWPLQDTLPSDMKYEREIMPLSRVLLRPGDLLYIPCGYWHRAESTPSTDEASISIAVGVMSKAAIDIFDVLRKRSLDSLLWRQRLCIGSETEAVAYYQNLLSQLADDLSGRLRSPGFVRAVVQHFASFDGENSPEEG